MHGAPDSPGDVELRHKVGPRSDARKAARQSPLAPTDLVELSLLLAASFNEVRILFLLQYAASC